MLESDENELARSNLSINEIEAADLGISPDENLSINETGAVDLGISTGENFSINETEAVGLTLSPKEKSFRKVRSGDGLRAAPE